MKKNIDRQQLIELQHASKMNCKELSARELYIARLLAWGYYPEEIAEKLFLSIHTVRQHIKNIYLSLDVHKDTDLTRWYIMREYGIADTPFKRIVTVLMIIIMVGSLFEMSCNARIMRSNTRIAELREIRLSRSRRAENELKLIPIS